jgi:hypothetical protein
MKFKIAATLVAAVAIAIILTSNSLKGTKNESSTAMSKVSKDVSELKKLLEIPASPLEVEFEVTRWPGGDSNVCALLTYAASDVAAILTSSKVIRPDGGFLQIQMPKWLAERLGGALKTQTDGGQSVVLPHYEVVKFAKSPLLQGVAFSPSATQIVACIMST